MQTAEIVTVADYLQALIEVGHLMTFEPDRGTPDGDRLEALTCLAEAVEAPRYSPNLAEIEVR